MILSARICSRRLEVVISHEFFLNFLEPYVEMPLALLDYTHPPLWLHRHILKFLASRAGVHRPWLNMLLAAPSLPLEYY
jgi:hypothetical protein